MKEAILLTDGYKLDHRRQYPENTEYVYSNWTPRSCHYYPEATEGAVVFGIQYFIKEYLMKQFQQDFFNKPKDVAVAEFKRRVDTFLGPNNVGTKHIEELHDLGYLPIRIKALPEGTLCPIRVPALTFINTHPDFFWLTNYFETLISTTLWLPMTSATTARLYKKELIRHARKTGFKDVDLNFLIHDFSMRGMAGVEAAIMSGMGHMTSFCGSEHSVMCAGGKEDELETFRRLITEVYPTGFVSIVSDTWDFWKVMTEYLPKLKDEILARDGRLVIRPDSGNPVHIIAGYKQEDFENWREQVEAFKIISPIEWVGAYEVLWGIFGGTINEKGYKVLNPKVGIIYGDSITLERQKEIYKRLEERGFAATNLVLGVGSYTYQYKSRDSLGFAMKATWCQVNGEGREIFKDPKTDDGTKKSLKGLICVQSDGNKYIAEDQVTKEQEDKSCLQTVFEDGKLVKEWSLRQIRDNVNNSIVLED
jgi:nicotinamide phosphoribosyltransferase